MSVFSAPTDVHFLRPSDNGGGVGAKIVTRFETVCFFLLFIATGGYSVTCANAVFNRFRAPNDQVRVKSYCPREQKKKKKGSCVSLDAITVFWYDEARHTWRETEWATAYFPIIRMSTPESHLTILLRPETRVNCYRSRYNRIGLHYFVLRGENGRNKSVFAGFFFSFSESTIFV